MQYIIPFRLREKENERITWTAYTYLVDLPSRMNHGKLLFLAGFSWGYTEDADKHVDLLDFKVLSGEDWKEHHKYVDFL